MSRTETHIGTLTEFKLGHRETIHDACLRVLTTYGKKPSDEMLQHEGFDMIDYFNDALHEKYIRIKDKIYIIGDNELDDGEDVDFFREISPGKYIYVYQFYNGATCFTECIENSLKHI